MTALLKGKEAFLKWLANNGFAVMVAFMLIWAISDAVKWVAQEIFIPARDRFFQHLDTVEAGFGKQEAATRAVEREIEKHGHVLENVATSSSKTSEAAQEVKDILGQIRDANCMPMLHKSASASAAINAASETSKHLPAAPNKPGG
jgi:hypothetical protein